MRGEEGRDEGERSERMRGEEGREEGKRREGMRGRGVKG